MTVAEQEYRTIKDKFFAKHKHDFRVDTSSMDSYGRWYKDYIFADGSNWHEDYYPTWEEGIAIVHDVEVPVEVKMLRTEYYSTDDATSRYVYEQF